MIEELNELSYRRFVLGMLNQYSSFFHKEIIEIIGKNEITPSYETLEKHNIRFGMMPVILDNGVEKLAESRSYKFGEFPNYEDIEYLYNIGVKHDSYTVRAFMKSEYKESSKDWVNLVFPDNIDLMDKLCCALESKKILTHKYPTPDFKNVTLFTSLNLLNHHVDIFDHFMVEVEIEDDVNLIFDTFEYMEQYSSYLESHICTFEIKFKDVVL